MLADRYVYTAFARDVARGVDPRWVRALYRFAVVPTMAFYFRVPLEVALNRILSGRPKLKWYEAGMDLGLHTDAAGQLPHLPGAHPRRVRAPGAGVPPDRDGRDAADRDAAAAPAQAHRAAPGRPAQARCRTRHAHAAKVTP